MRRDRHGVGVGVLMRCGAVIAGIAAAGPAMGQCSPTVLGTVSFNGALNSAIVDIAAGDGVVFVAERYGVHAVSVADPAHPVLLSSLFSNPQVRVIELRGDRLYVANSAGFSVWDVSDPADMQVLGSSFTGGNGRSLDVIGTRVDLLTYPPAFPFVWPVSIWDMQNPASPVLLGEFSSIQGGNPEDIVSSGAGYAYAVTTPRPPSTTAGLRVIDTDPAAAAGVVTVVPGDFDSVEMVGSYVLASKGVTITVFDVSNPTAPGQVRTLTTPQGIAKIVLDRPLIFAGGGIYDFSAPREPVALGVAARVLEARNGMLFEGIGTGRPFTLLVHDAGCDRDGDGLLDSWEIDGVPYVDAAGQARRYILDDDGDGMSDADPAHKDLFIEVDVMAGPGGGSVRFSEASLEAVRTAFAAAPVANPDGRQGVTLHTIVDEMTIPYEAVVESTQMAAYRQQWFGSSTEHGRAGLLAAKAATHRHAMFLNRIRIASGKYAMGYTTRSTDTFAVALGGFQRGPSEVERYLGSTFMHELGHALGLQHGGGDPVHYKPNYVSAMNYNFDELLVPDGTGWARLPLAFSAEPLDTLREDALDERAGVPTTASAGVYVPHGYSDGAGSTRVGWVVLGAGAADWNHDGPHDALVVEDLTWFPHDHPLASGRTPGGELKGHDDWSAVRYAVPGECVGCRDEALLCELTEELLQWHLDHIPPPPASTCSVDLNGDGVVDFGDYLEFLNLYEVFDPRVDFNRDGIVDFGDYLEFLNLFDAGC